MENKLVRHIDRQKLAKEMKEVCHFVGLTLISEIVCKCGHKNKARKEWLSGLMMDECEKCHNGLPIIEIYGAIPETMMLDILSDDKKEMKATEVKKSCEIMRKRDHIFTINTKPLKTRQWSSGVVEDWSSDFFPKNEN